MQRKHVERCRWCVCVVNNGLRIDATGGRFSACLLTYWDKLQKVQVIFTLLFSPHVHSFVFCCVVSLCLVSAKCGRGHTDEYWYMAGKCAGKWQWGWILSWENGVSIQGEDHEWDDSYDEQGKNGNAGLSPLWVQIATWANIATNLFLLYQHLCHIPLELLLSTATWLLCTCPWRAYLSRMVTYMVAVGKTQCGVLEGCFVKVQSVLGHK